jgi:hypothetical protein
MGTMNAGLTKELHEYVETIVGERLGPASLLRAFSARGKSSAWGKEFWLLKNSFIQYQ